MDRRLLDRFGQPVDTVRNSSDQPARRRLGARVSAVVLLGPFMAFARWRNR